VKWVGIVINHVKGTMQILKKKNQSIPQFPPLVETHDSASFEAGSVECHGSTTVLRPVP
jgi:hypothetical protein